MSFLSEVIEKYNKKIADMEQDVKDILKQEEEEKEVIAVLQGMVPSSFCF